MAHGELFYALFLGKAFNVSNEMYAAQVDLESDGQITNFITNLAETYADPHTGERRRRYPPPMPYPTPEAGAGNNDTSLVGQCVQLVRYVLWKSGYDPRCFTNSGHAWTWALPNVVVPTGFCRYYFTGNNVINVIPMPGDIFVWDRCGNNPYGHIGFLRDQITAPQVREGEYRLISARTVDQNRTGQEELDSRMQNFANRKLTALIRQIKED